MHSLALASHVSLLGFIKFWKEFVHIFTVMKVQVRELPLRIDFSHVIFVGKPVAAWRYLMAGLMLGRSYTWYMPSEVDGATSSMKWRVSMTSSVVGI